MVPRGGDLTYNGDPRVGKLTFENLKMPNFPWVGCKAAEFKTSIVLSPCYGRFVDVHATGKPSALLKGDWLSNK